MYTVKKKLSLTKALLSELQREFKRKHNMSDVPVIMIRLYILRMRQTI